MTPTGSSFALNFNTDPASPPAAAPASACAELVAQFIPCGARILELGYGTVPGQRALPNGCAWGAHDLKGGGFPSQAAKDADLIVMVDTLEHVTDIEALFANLRGCRRDVLLSYCATDLSGSVDRTARGWLNHFSLYDLASLFDRYGFRIVCTAPVDDSQVLILLKPIDRLMPIAPTSVAVISNKNDGNFGSRLGYHMINALLPSEATVDHLTFDALEAAREEYDLVVLGVGNSMFQPLLGDNVLEVVKRGKAAIGIFGTQYRELIPRPSIERVLDRLDTWFARNEDDVLLYGRGRNNVVHLGDWLIDQFPITRATEDQPLKIDDEILNNLPLDRTIQSIQRHKNVYSMHLHPLLCALTSAEFVAYSEQASAEAPGIASGKFRSMLIDVFGRTFPERKFFVIDREAVARYKAQVHRNVAKVGERIEAILRNVAVATV